MTFSKVIEQRERTGITFPAATNHSHVEYIASINSEVCGVCLQTLSKDSMWGECPGWSGK